MYVFASNKVHVCMYILLNLGFKNNVGFHNVYHNASKYICKLIYRKKSNEFFSPNFLKFWIINPWKFEIQSYWFKCNLSI